jgi:phosphoribosylformylglycinamidine (FGAM) synthase-like amidotransferase family enzyme
VSLDVANTPSSDVFFKSLKSLELPMRHGEGNLKLEISSELSPEKQQDVLKLVKDHATLRYSEDVNGSLDRIASLSSKDGTVMGLMPHPEAFIRFTQHPNWTDRNWSEAQTNKGSGKPAGLVIFENAFNYVNCAN